MQWLAAWWRQIVGPPRTDPWNDDPQVRKERASQHDRINKTHRWGLHDQISDAWSERTRERWLDTIEETWRRDAHH